MAIDWHQDLTLNFDDMNEFEGLTVNERLYVSGLIERFDNAVKDENLDLIRLILREVKLDENAISEILRFYKL